MKYYPELSELQRDREMIDVFKGYNHNLRIGEGEFYDMTNLSSDNYPILSPRPKRGIYAEPLMPQGLISKDALCYVDGRHFVINEYKIDMDLTDTPKTLISMGAYVIIMPDKKYINTENHNDRGDIEESFETNGSTVFTLSKVDGVEHDNVEYGDSAPTITDDMREGKEDIPLWMDTSGETHSLKQYSLSSSSWNSIATTYVKISSPGIGISFSVGDAVLLDGIVTDGVTDLNGHHTIVAKVNDFIVVKGFLASMKTQAAEKKITITRKMPNMDFIIESGNRLWGCRYGVALNGAIVNEIYASKLGDFKNWNCFDSISTDSYVASVGTDGKFTGAITHLGYPIFFKENAMHKVYGNYPANYQIQTTACRGVQDGCSKSLAIVNEVLYYKSRSGVCAYDGSLPTEVSSALGDVNYHDAVAGVLGNKYYISMADDSEEHHLFVCDTKKGMWHREDNTQAMDFCNCRGDLYYIDSDKRIKTVKGSGVAKESKPIEWEAVTGVLGTDSPDKKYISRLDVRMFLEIDARVMFFIEYDSSGEWEYLFTMTGVKLSSFPVPIKPKRCDHMRLKMVGTGDAKVFSICKTIEQGSDV